MLAGTGGSRLNDRRRESFFLNELDGFENNMGMVVLATTNHADRLDAAILNRPSRFDRKYYFNLPGVEERRAYVVAWNNSANVKDGVIDSHKIGGEVGTASDRVRVALDTVRHSALRLSAEAIEEVVHQTEDFSFAYLKELFLSATMQWISTRAVALDSAGFAPADELSMDEIIREQTALLRDQMTASSASVSSASAVGRVGHAIANAYRYFRS